jgi:hypothetical protein
MNEKIPGSGNKVMKRIYNADTLAYQEHSLIGHSEQKIERFVI